MPAGAAPSAIVLPLRVYIEDTDAGGIVYYVNYLKYFERARTELMRALGIARAALPGAQCQFVVHTMQVQYLRPALLDDELGAEARIESATGARIVFAQRILRGAEELCRGQVSVACVDPATGRPRALPAEWRERLAAPRAASRSRDLMEENPA
jgi:4-hydroxybenzoyl-CoA thioesterase/acyl-CoA thioester hydrolase